MKGFSPKPRWRWRHRLQVVRPARLLLRTPLVIVALLAACATSTPSYSSANGPLGDGRTLGGGCFRMAFGQPVTMGNFDLRNRGDAAVTITHITLPFAHGLRMTRAWLVPIDDHAPGIMLGIAGGPYPPVWQQWISRRPLIGGVIRPHQGLILVFGLIRTNAKAEYGRSAGPKITYSSAGRTYTVSEQATLEVAAKC
jgi:hypothetical protein